MSEAAAVPFDTYASRGDATVAKAIAGVAGSDGETYDAWLTSLSGGPETNPALRHPAQFAVYNEMRRSDPGVKSLLWMFKLPIRSAVWDLTEADDGADPNDRLIADALAWQFGLQGKDARLNQTWDEQLMQSMLRLDWGSMFEEIIWAADVEQLPLPDVDRLVRPMEQLAPRAPATIKRITQDPVRGVVVKIEQNLTNTKPIPEEKAVVNVFEKEGRNWYGTSILRPVYGPWRLKRGLLISSAIAWDRWASGIPVVRHPPDEESQRRAETIGKNVRTHERAYVALPGSADAGWGLELLNTGAISDPTPLLRHYDAQIAVAGIQQFSILGRTESGSRAVGDVQVSPFYMALQALAKEIAATKTKQMFRRWVDVNFGTQYDLPELTVSKIDPEPFVTLAQAIYDLSNAGFYFKDRDVQNDLRDRMELPHLPDEMAETVEKLPEPVGLDQLQPQQIAPPPEGTGLNL